MRFLIVMLCSVVWSATAIAKERTSEQTLRAFLAESGKPQRGDVFSQAALDGVDYPSLLRGAVARENAALVGLFGYTSTGKLMGEGFYSNAAILAALLERWGDERFAAALRPMSTRVRRAVSATLGENLTPVDFARRFPHTYSLAVPTPPA